LLNENVFPTVEKNLFFISGIPLAESNMAMALVLENLERMITMMV